MRHSLKTNVQMVTSVTVVLRDGLLIGQTTNYRMNKKGRGKQLSEKEEI